jgi:hypothetical protein
MGGGSDRHRNIAPRLGTACMNGADGGFRWRYRELFNTQTMKLCSIIWRCSLHDALHPVRVRGPGVLQ